MSKFLDHIAEGIGEVLHIERKGPNMTTDNPVTEPDAEDATEAPELAGNLPPDPAEPVGNIVPEPEAATSADSSVPADPTPSTPTVPDHTVPVPDPVATAAAGVAAAAAQGTAAAIAPAPLAGAPMSAETRAWLEANGSHVWVVTAD